MIDAVGGWEQLLCLEIDIRWVWMGTGLGECNCRQREMSDEDWTEILCHYNFIVDTLKLC